MEYPSDITIKAEKDDLDLDSNDNYQQLLLDVEIKVEKEVETNDEEDWCVKSSENCGDLVDPLFFKQVTALEGPQCSLCCKYFTDGHSILKHNLTHLQVTIINSTLFQCDYCNSYFVDKRMFKRHILKHNQNISKTSALSYKPKSYKPDKPAVGSNCILKNLKMLQVQPKYSAKIDYYKQIDTIAACKPRMKLKDGMTSALTYKPKSCKLKENCDFKPKQENTEVSETETMFRNEMRPCKICRKTYSYKHWHAHMQEVHGNGDYFCGICNIEFKCERYFMTHMKKKHSSQRLSKGAVKMDVKCDLCDAVLNSLNALKTHKRTVHSASQHVCHICNSKLKCKSYLLAHMRRVHYDDGKKHFCECGKSFKSPRYLMVHKRNAHFRK